MVSKFSHMISDIRHMISNLISKKEGKDQESILSSTTPDPGVKKHNKTSHTREPRGQPFSSR